MNSDGFRFRVDHADRLDHSAEWQWENPGGRRDDWFFWLIAGGRGRLFLPDRTILLRPGVVVTYPLSTPLRGEQDMGNLITIPWATFSFVDADRHEYQQTGASPMVFKADDSVFLGNLMDRMIDGFREGKIREAEHWMGSVWREALRQDEAVRAGRGGSDQARRIDRLCALIRHAPERRYDLGDIARLMHCTPDHAIRLFKKYRGVTPREYVLRRRVERAKTLLLFTDHPVGRIAHMLGYRDVYYFSRQFRQRTGRSPSAFRREA